MLTLTSKLFAKHYHPALDDAVQRSWDGTAARMSGVASAA